MASWCDKTRSNCIFCAKFVPKNKEKMTTQGFAGWSKLSVNTGFVGKRGHNLYAGK
jgi:hypothetical protein